MNMFEKFGRTVTALVTMAMVSSLLLSTPAFAIKGDTTRFNTCKKLESLGKVAWHGIATGTENDAFTVLRRDRTFHTKACFTSQKACKTWVKRIWWEIPTMDELHNAWCQKL